MMDTMHAERLWTDGAHWIERSSGGAKYRAGSYRTLFTGYDLADVATRLLGWVEHYTPNRAPSLRAYIEGLGG